MGGCTSIPPEELVGMQLNKARELAKNGQVYCAKREIYITALRIAKIGDKQCHGKKEDVPGRIDVAVSYTGHITEAPSQAMLPPLKTGIDAVLEESGIQGFLDMLFQNT
jgi:hypothetical protein